ncbi:alkyl hydroperoxide reductase AhpD [Mycobacterium paraintracellulare]|nr:alkyl hydroperoxide reductase AhpD [Mycobacterium paraintracellulare]
MQASAAVGLVAKVYQQMERDFGFLAPPISLHSPSPEVMAASWLMMRETLLASGRAARVLKESVASAVSEANTCPYCVEVHDAIRHSIDGTYDANAVRAWVAGGPRPFPDDQLEECVGVAVAFEYVNRMNHVFLPESPVPARVPRLAHNQVRRTLGGVAAPGKRAIEPGDSLALLSEAPLPDDLSWSAGHATVAGAFARASAVIDSAGARSLPLHVRDLVNAWLSGDAGEIGLSRSWVDQAVDALPAADRTVVKLALLTALASHQVDADIVASARRDCADDAALVDLTAWASWSAARRAASRYLH